MNPEQLSGLGADIAVVGTVVSCYGVLQNNVYLNHTFAMQIQEREKEVVAKVNQYERD